MLIRNETFNLSGVCIAADVIDLQAGTIAREENGVVVSTRALTDDERTRYTPAPDLRAELLAQLSAEPVMLDDITDALARAIAGGLL